MRDIYSSDKNGRKDSKYEKDFYYDPYYEDDGGAGDGKFHVNIPKEKLGGGTDGRSREPIGRPAEVHYAPMPKKDYRNRYYTEPDDMKTAASYSHDDRTPKGAPLYRQGSGGTYSDTRDEPMVTPKRVSVKDRERSTSGRGRVIPQDRIMTQSKKGSSDIRSTSKPSKMKKPKKKGTAKKVFISVVSILLVLVIALGSMVYAMLGKISYDDTALEKNKYIKASALASNSKVQNILFLGSDYRDGEVQGTRSDTMILFSIDKINKQIKLTSFLRDSYVYLPSQDSWRKLNASCALGGAQLVKDTLEYNFKVKIDNYVMVDFEVFTTFIDKIGGLDVSGVTKEEAEYMRNVVKAPNVKKGKNHFTGGAALWYCRIRYLDDDFHRTQRQRKVISALISQVKKTNPKKLYDAISAVLPMIKTDIPKNKLVSLGACMLTTYSRYDIKQFRVPKDGTWDYDNVYIDGSIIRLDIEKNASLLKKFIYPSKNKKK